MRFLQLIKRIHIYAKMERALHISRERTIKADELVTAPAAERNKQPILDVLIKHIPTNAPLQALEIASGTGQHVVHFANYFHNVTWRPCEYERASMKIINDHITYSKLTNVLPPLYVDASLPVGQWAGGTLRPDSFDVIYSANMMHISPWRVSQGFIEGAGQLLKKSGLLIIYGPFGLDGIITPQSNINFDISLRNRNPEWGVRDRRHVEKVAEMNGFTFQTSVDMPANNKTLVFKKVS